MINEILRRLHRPEAAWDPVGAQHAQRYADYEWANLDRSRVDWLEAQLGPVAGRRVLDLGGGPGHYSVEFARRGADVTWHDVSRRYLAIAQTAAADHGVQIHFSLGYLEEAPDAVPFDLVFVRLCWRYATSDRAFAARVSRLVGPRGSAYVDTEYRQGRGSLADWRGVLNDRTGLKLGHPNPRRGAVAAHLIRQADWESVLALSDRSNDRILASLGRWGDAPDEGDPIRR